MFKKLFYLPLLASLAAVACLVLLSVHAFVSKNPVSSAVESNEPFTVIVLPDTQVYAEQFPHIFDEQTKWIAANKEKRNILFVSHLGDIVDDPEVEAQWQLADKAMGRLDGVVPYGLAPGNHDMDADGNAPLYSKYFPMSRLKKADTWGGSFFGAQGSYRKDKRKGDKNSYQLFNSGSHKYIAFNLEFCPSDDVLAWTNDVLDHYRDRKAIITTHSFLTHKAEWSADVHCEAYNSEGDNSGGDIWSKLSSVKQNRNLLLILSGHDNESDDGAAQRTDVIDGNTVYQLLSNYQHFENGGNGYLRIMTFMPAEQKIKVETYSPYLKQYRTDPDNAFEIHTEL